MRVTGRDLWVGGALLALLACGVANYLTARQTADTLREDTAVVFGRLGVIEDLIMDKSDPKVTSWKAIFMGAKVTHTVSTSQGDLTEEAWCKKHESQVARDMKTFVPCEMAPK